MQKWLTEMSPPGLGPRTQMPEMGELIVHKAELFSTTTLSECSGSSHFFFCL